MTAAQPLPWQARWALAARLQAEHGPPTSIVGPSAAEAFSLGAFQAHCVTLHATRPPTDATLHRLGLVRLGSGLWHTMNQTPIRLTPRGPARATRLQIGPHAARIQGLEDTILEQAQAARQGGDPQARGCVDLLLRAHAHRIEWTTLLSRASPLGLRETLAARRERVR